VAGLVVGQSPLLLARHALDWLPQAELVILDRPREVLIGDHVAVVPVRHHDRLVDDVLDLDRRVPDRVADHSLD
jgi:hypothetical protein